jgi:hypothetical protein
MTTRPTRHEQALAILNLKASRFASKILGRHARTTEDFEEAFTLEHVDLVAAIPNRDALLALGRNRVGPRDGLYVLDDGETYRVYVQERGETYFAERGLSFDRARDAVIERLIRLNGIPFTPPGA